MIFQFFNYFYFLYSRSFNQLCGGGPVTIQTTTGLLGSQRGCPAVWPCRLTNQSLQHKHSVQSEPSTQTPCPIRAFNTNILANQNHQQKYSVQSEPTTEIFFPISAFKRNIPSNQSLQQKHSVQSEQWTDLFCPIRALNRNILFDMKLDTVILSWC